MRFIPVNSFPEHNFIKVNIYIHESTFVHVNVNYVINVITNYLH